jgi:hypothetical protein
VRDEPDGYRRSFRSQSITARGSGSSGLRGGGEASEGCNDCGYAFAVEPRPGVCTEGRLVGDQIVTNLELAMRSPDRKPIARVFR